MSSGNIGSHSMVHSMLDVDTILTTHNGWSDRIQPDKGNRNWRFLRWKSRTTHCLDGCDGDLTCGLITNSIVAYVEKCRIQSNASNDSNVVRLCDKYRKFVDGFATSTGTSDNRFQHVRIWSVVGLFVFGRENPRQFSTSN